MTNDMLESKLYSISNNNVTVKDLFIACVILIISWIFLIVLKKTIYRNFKIDDGRKYAIFQIIKYFVFVISCSLILQILGIDVTVIIASSAALLVGLGMGIQHLFNDFVSGFIVLMDGTVKVGDIIELEGMISKVKVINIRTTTVETRDNKNIILPNSTLTNKNLINWTHSEVTSRFDVVVGIDYNSNLALAMKTIELVANNNINVLPNPKPFVRLVDFGDSSLKLQLFFWTEDVFRVEQVKSDIRVNIHEEFAALNIKIPFPQRTIHIKN